MHSVRVSVRAVDGDRAVWHYNFPNEALEIPDEVRLTWSVSGGDLHRIHIRSVAVIRTVFHSALDRIKFQETECR